MLSAYLTLIGVVALLMLVPGLAAPARLMTVRQSTYYLSSPFLDYNTVFYFNIPHDPQHHEPTTKYQIILSGYYYIPRFCNYVSAYIVTATSTYLYIQLHSGCSYKFVGVAMYVLAVVPNNFAWATSDRIHPSYIRDLPNNGTELAVIPAPTSVINIDDFKIVPMTSGWVTNSNASYMSFLNLALHSKTNSTAIYVSMTIAPTMKLSRVWIQNIWVNLTALSLTNHPRYFADVNVYWNSPTDKVMFDDLPPAFGIPQQYRNSSTGLWPNCFIGFGQFQLGASARTDSAGYLIADFFTNTVPFTQRFQSPLHNGSVQKFSTKYQIFCFGHLCPYLHYFDPGSHLCLPCSYVNYCSKCLLDVCVECMLGYLVGGRCILEPGCLDFVQLADGSQVCMSCDSRWFRLSNQTNGCECYEGTELFDGKCHKIVPGCVTYRLISGTTANQTSQCLSCNTVASFNSTPDSQGLCLCKSGFSLADTICLQTCGDGIQLNQSRSACDDGNIIDGDGCSSLCQTQMFYRCFNGSKNSPSACVYKGRALTITLKQTHRVDGSNSGTFFFAVQPGLLNLKRMNLSKYLAFDCDSSYSLTQSTYNNGQLLLTVDFTDDLQARNCNLTLAYDPSIIDRPSSELSFTVKSDDVPLTVSTKLKEYQNIKFIFNVIAWIALGLFVLGLSFKMVGVELLNCCQIVYISLCLYSQPELLYSAISGLDTVTGGWSFLADADNLSLLPGFTDRVKISSNFIENSGIVAATLTFFCLLWTILMFIKHCSCQQNDSTDEVQPKPQQKCITTKESSQTQLTAAAKGIKIAYNWVIFPVTAGFLLTLSITVFLGSSHQFMVNTPDFMIVLGSLAKLFLYAVIGSVFAIEIFSVDPYAGTQNEPKIDKLYIPLFLGKAVIFANILTIGFSSFIPTDFSAYIITLLQATFFMYLVIKRPYGSVLMNIGAISCALCALYALGLPLLRRVYTPSEDTDVLLLFGLQGLLVLAELLTLVRIVWSLQNYIRSHVLRREQDYNKDKKDIQDKKVIKGKKNSKFGKVQRQVDDIANNESPYAPYLPKRKGKTSQIHSDILSRQRKKKASKVEEEQNQTLRMIRQKLREDLKQKKGCRNSLLGQQ